MLTAQKQAADGREVKAKTKTKFVRLAKALEKKKAQATIAEKNATILDL